MNMTPGARSPGWIFIVLQAAAVLLAVLGLLFALHLLSVGFVWIGIALVDMTSLMTTVLMTLIGVLGVGMVIGTAVGCCRALWSFFRMCGRLRQERAFTAGNERALRTIGRSLLFCAALLALGSVATALCMLLVQLQSAPFTLSLPVDLLHAFLPVLVLAFLLLGVSLVAEVLRELLLRAMAQQQEQDETV